MKLKLPGGAFSAYLFDCDGTIVDSMPSHYIAWRKALGEWNCEFDEKLFYAWGGMPILEIIATLNKQRGLSMPVETVAHRKESLYFELLPQLKAVPEVLEIIRARQGRIPFAVVSGSVLESVTASLRALNLLDRFDTLVCAGDYKKSKPDPEAFSAGRDTAESRARILPGLRRYRHGHSGCDFRSHGFRQNPAAVGAITQKLAGLSNADGSIHSRNANHRRPGTKFHALVLLVPGLAAFIANAGAATEWPVAIRFQHYARLIP
jgi:phosphoglycolate phosphatase-like HAD superfamily hydrolase